MENVFQQPATRKSHGLIYPMFDQGIVQRYIGEKSKAHIRTRDLKEVFESGGVELYAGLCDNNIDQLNLVDLNNNINFKV